MKVGIFTPVFYPENFLINDLTFELASKGHDVVISTSLPTYESKFIRKGYSLLSGPYSESAKGVIIKRYPVIPRRKNLFFLALNYISNLFFGVLNLIRIPRTDVNLVFSVSPIFTAIPGVIRKIIFKTPLVLWLQDPWPETFADVLKINERHFVYKLLGQLTQWIYSHTDLILIQSQAYRPHLDNFGYKGQIESLPNWAPDMRVLVDEVPNWVAKLPENRFLLTFAGNIGKGQNLDQLLAAALYFKENKDFFIVLVGDGSEVERLKNFSTEHDLTQVIFTGRKPLADMPHLFQKSSCLYVSLTPNRLSELTIPSKVQAYMASGRPILASLRGQGAQIIKDAKCGFTVSPGNSTELQSAIQRFISLTSEQLSEVGARGKEYSQIHFNKDNLIEATENLLKELKK